MKKALSFITGAAIGGVVGAVLAMLFAPSTGQNLRNQITEYVLQTKDDVMKAGQDRRDELEHELEVLRQPQE
jgi:gas vesicle protein